MSDDLLTKEYEDKPQKNKPGPKPKATRPEERAAIGKGIEASRISYKDRRKLSVKGRDPNFVYRIVNHDGNKYAGNVANRLDMGYKFANDGETLGDLQGVGSSSLGSKIGTHVGSGTQGILMKIRREDYIQDQTEKQAEVDLTELGMIDDELKNADGMYGDGLKVADGRGTRLEVKVRTT